jgi:hypothetical protein
MLTMWERKRVLSESSNQSSALKDTLARLDIVPLTAEWVAEYKRAKLEEMTCQLRPNEAQEINEGEFNDWEYGELRRLRKKTERHELSSDAPLIRFWRLPCGVCCYTYLRWVRMPLKKAGDIPEFVTAKAREIASARPDTTFSVEQLRSERDVYDPFLMVSYGDESYYIEVWKEPAFESEHT